MKKYVLKEYLKFYETNIKNINNDLSVSKNIIESLYSEITANKLNYDNLFYKYNVAINETDLNSKEKNSNRNSNITTTNNSNNSDDNIFAQFNNNKKHDNFESKESQTSSSETDDDKK